MFACPRSRDQAPESLFTLALAQLTDILKNNTFETSALSDIKKDSHGCYQDHGRLMNLGDDNAHASRLAYDLYAGAGRTEEQLKGGVKDCRLIFDHQGVYLSFSTADHRGASHEVLRCHPDIIKFCLHPDLAANITEYSKECKWQDYVLENQEADKTLTITIIDPEEKKLGCAVVEMSKSLKYNNETHEILSVKSHPDQLGDEPVALVVFNLKNGKNLYTLIPENPTSGEAACSPSISGCTIPNGAKPDTDTVRTMTAILDALMGFGWTREHLDGKNVLGWMAKGIGVFDSYSGYQTKFITWKNYPKMREMYEHNSISKLWDHGEDVTAKVVDAIKGLAKQFVKAVAVNSGKITLSVMNGGQLVLWDEETDEQVSFREVHVKRIAFDCPGHPLLGAHAELLEFHAPKSEEANEMLEEHVNVDAPKSEEANEMRQMRVYQVLAPADLLNPRDDSPVKANE